MQPNTKPIVLLIGEPIKYNVEYYEQEFLRHFNVVRNECLDRESFMTALRNNAFGDFCAIFRPHFQSGGEMGQWNEQLISLLPQSVRIFASAGAGYDWADVDCLARHGIWYANGAGASDDAVSDTALWMILSVFRNFTRSQLAARTADPERFQHAHRTNALISKNPKGQNLGIIGLGNISTLLVRKAQAIGMNVLYYDVYRRSPEQESLNGQTRHLINARTLALMRPGSRLVNTARGEIVDEGALVEALQSGHLAAAGLDVHYREPQVSRILAQMDNVTLTTHVAGGALDTRMNFELGAMKNIIQTIMEEKRPVTAVNEPLRR